MCPSLYISLAASRHVSAFFSYSFEVVLTAIPPFTSSYTHVQLCPAALASREGCKESCTALLHRVFDFASPRQPYCTIFADTHERVSTPTIGTVVSSNPPPFSVPRLPRKLVVWPLVDQFRRRWPCDLRGLGSRVQDDE